MFRRDFFLVASTAATCSLLAYLVGTTSTTPPEVLRCESGASYGNHATALSRTDDKAVQVEAGNQRLAVLRDSESHPDKNTARDAPASIQRQQELGERFSHLFNSGTNADSSVISATIENRFYSEEWHQEWAGSMERNIRTLFDTNKALSGMAPLQVTCRSKNCQVVFSTSTQDEVRAVSDRFMREAIRSDVGMKDQVVSFFPDISMGRVVFYLSENGDMELFQ
jgi:hypothetical protein